MPSVILARLETEVVLARFLQRFEVSAAGPPTEGSHFSGFATGDLAVRRA